MTATASLIGGLPSTRDEAWRYTPVEDIIARLQIATPAAPARLTSQDIDSLAGDRAGPRLVFVNGIHAPELSDVDVLPRGVRYPAEAGFEPGPGERFDGFQALNAVAGNPAVLRVDQGVDVDGPIHVVHVAVPGNDVSVSHPRTIVEVGPGSRVNFVETFCGFVGSALTNASTTIRVGAGASVTHYRVQTEAGGATHVGHTGIEQAERSDVHITSVMLGADIARSAIDVVLAGEGARTELSGLYLPADHQRHDNMITVDHAASRCTSTQLFKGVVDGHARGSFSGRVIVRPGTVGTDARQLNRNLILGPTAQADTRPWLEILADDVRCSHGASVGRLDDDALFYLRSRGIPNGLARTMLVDAFIAEITDRVSPPSLRDHVSAVILARSGGAS